MKKALVIIDMQNDFITGSLANPDAERIVPGIVEKIHQFKGDIFATKDTHTGGYLSTQEGQMLPVVHCIKGTDGWKLHEDIYQALKARRGYHVLHKSTFGLAKFAWGNYDEYEIVGTCTDICVVSNALIIKALHPEAKIRVIASLCAGTSKEAHCAALTVMRGCQIEVM